MATFPLTSQLPSLLRSGPLIGRHGQGVARGSLNRVLRSPTGQPRDRDLSSCSCRSVQAMAGTSEAPSQAAQQTDSDIEFERFHQHQASAARLSFSEEARTLVELGRSGVISTISASGQLQGTPMGSVVEFAADSHGKPIFAFSSLSGHTRDLQQNPACSFTVMSTSFQDIADARVTLSGAAHPVAQEEQAAARELYLCKNPGSFWVDFGDFTWFRMNAVVSARLVGGFARAATVTGDEYAAATPDPIAPFSKPIAGHMNADHASSTAAMVEHYIGFKADAAQINAIDRLGMDLQVTRQSETYRCRLPFTRPVQDRKDVKTVIVEMTRAAAGR